MLDIADSNDIIDCCTALFSYSDVLIGKRVGDVQSICALTLNNSKITTTQADCFASAIKRTYALASSMSELEDVLSVFACIKDLDVLGEVAERCAVYAYHLLSSKVESAGCCWVSMISLSEYPQHFYPTVCELPHSRNRVFGA